MNNILKEREERVKRVRQEQEAERIRKAEEWKQQVSLIFSIKSRIKLNHNMAVCNANGIRGT